MANVDHPHGLRAVMSRTMGTPRQTKYVAHINTTTPVGIFRGDPVQLLATGKVKTITTTTGVDSIVGVAANYIAGAAANDDSDVWVYDDPDTIFEIQSDGTTDPGASTARGHIGNTAPLVLTAGNAATGQSQIELDYSAMTTGTADAVMVVGHYEVANNDMTLMHARYLVNLVKHLYKLPQRVI
jgi:hypothetical protein